MNKIQHEGFPSVGIPPTGQWYEPQTTTGKIALSPLEVLPSMAIGPGGPVNKIVRSVAGGVTGEGASEFAKAIGFDEAAPWAKALGTLGGAAYGPAVARKIVTPHPQSAEHAAAVQKLKDAGVTDKELTAGAFTGSPKLLQREANLATKGSLEAVDEAAFTRALAGESGMPGVSQLTPEVINKAKAGFDAYKGQIAKTIMSPTNFSSLKTSIDDVRKEAFKNMHVGGKAGPEMQVVDEAVNLIKGGPGAAGMLGSRYQALRSQLQTKINESSGPLKDSLSKLRGTLDDHMGKEFPAGELVKHQRQSANFDMLESASKKMTAQRQVTPEAMKDTIHDRPGWGPKAYSEGRGLSDTTQAGHRVFGNRPVPNKEAGPVSKAVSTMAGAGLAHQQAATSGEAILAMLLGHQMAPVIHGGGRLAAKGAYFNPMTQGFLKNQVWKPGEVSDVNKAMAARLLRGPVPATLQQPTE
jgi:hypothetical protein